MPSALTVAPALDLLYIYGHGCITDQRFMALFQEVAEAADDPSSAMHPRMDVLFDFRTVTSIQLSDSDLPLDTMLEMVHGYRGDAVYRSATIVTHPALKTTSKVLSETSYCPGAAHEIFDTLPEALAWLDRSEHEAAVERLRASIVEHV